VGRAGGEGKLSGPGVPGRGRTKQLPGSHQDHLAASVGRRGARPRTSRIPLCPHLERRSTGRTPHPRNLHGRRPTWPPDGGPGRETLRLSGGLNGGDIDGTACSLEGEGYLTFVPRQRASRPEPDGRHPGRTTRRSQAVGTENSHGQPGQSLVSRRTSHSGPVARLPARTVLILPTRRVASQLGLKATTRRVPTCPRRLLDSVVGSSCPPRFRRPSKGWPRPRAFPARPGWNARRADGRL